ncbi:queuosine precursor transporter [Patescibacteria group bacterium]
MDNNIIFVLQILAGLTFILIAFRIGFHWLLALIAVQAVLMNIFVLKMMNLFSWEVTGGNVLYASIFLGTDIICEHLGDKKARQAVWLGFFASLFFIVMSQFLMWYTPSVLDEGAFLHNTLSTIFTLAPRIVIASMLSYLISQHLDIFLFNKIKKWTKGKHLWLRNNGSTLVSQLVDSVFFTFVGLYGIVANAENFWQIVIFTYLIKALVALLDTPFIYLSKLKAFKPKKADTI